MTVEYMDHGKKKNLLKYKILGTVFSGDCDTTLMNTIRMAMYNRYVNDMAGLQFGKDYICFAKGDDFTLLYKPYVTDEFIQKAYYKYFLSSNPDPSDPKASIYGLGQVLKFLEFGDASILKFCSLNAWFTDTTETSIYLSRDIKKFLNLGLYSRKTKRYNLPQKVIYLEDIATSFLKNYGQITLFQHLAMYYQKLADRIKQQAKIPEKLLNFLRNKKEIQDLKHQITAQKYKNIFQKLELQNREYVAHRHTIIKEQENYWETMKNIEKIHIKTLTQEQADYISKEMELEISLEILKSLYDVGPKQNC